MFGLQSWFVSCFLEPELLAEVKTLRAHSLTSVQDPSGKSNMIQTLLSVASSDGGVFLCKQTRAKRWADSVYACNPFGQPRHSSVSLPGGHALSSHLQQLSTYFVNSQSWIFVRAGGTPTKPCQIGVCAMLDQWAVTSFQLWPHRTRQMCVGTHYN